MAVFVVSCVLLVWANTPPVIDTCRGFWEFMLASVLSPVIIPVAYFTLALGVVSWFSAAFPKATPHSHTAASSLVPPLLRKARYGVNLCGRSDFRAVALAAFAVVTLVMCVVATTNAACVEVFL